MKKQTQMVRKDLDNFLSRLTQQLEPQNSTQAVTQTTSQPSAKTRPNSTKLGGGKKSFHNFGQVLRENNVLRKPNNDTVVKNEKGPIKKRIKVVSKGL